MTSLFFEKDEVRQLYKPSTWQSVCWSELEAALCSNTRLFPCIYGVTGFNKNNLRFAFLEEMAASQVAAILSCYLLHAKQYGRYTSLVIFERPREVQNMESYREKFWSLLKELSILDKKPWPQDIPHNIDEPKWEFCFSGEPFFVVCNTPAHIKRQSRRSTGFMVAFQPRWVFQGITDDHRKAEQAFSNVRSRLQDYDFISPSPCLGRYGDENNREYSQYFIDDDNNVPKCPMSQLKINTIVS
ncbi:YqcI/YcgG family protein [Polycladidibacter stylochi]|uniref:YqcI/YcgG family protein n=1 Tax=Polycladidibacter stylochi TaxID=1807766 RepID=UPI00082A1D00|nr:YqcI/YcgG family protein [Pseudovibrio stylochi]